MSTNSSSRRDPASGQSLPPRHQTSNERATRQHRSGSAQSPVSPALVTASRSPSTSYEIPSLRRRPVPESDLAHATRHGRAVSRALPSIFGGRRDGKSGTSNAKDRSYQVGEAQTDTGQSADRVEASLRAGLNRRDVPMRTGKCMTCASAVRWPQDLKTFRCGTCSTVNDLEPNARRDGDEERFASRYRSNAISLEVTERLIGSCIDTYLLQRLTQSSTAEDGYTDATKKIPASSSNRRPTPAEAQGPELQSERSRKFEEHQDSTLSESSHQISIHQTKSDVKPHPSASLDTRSANSSSRTGADADITTSAANPRVFRAVEAYISECFAGCTALNLSFFSARPTNEQTGNVARPAVPDKLSVKRAGAVVSNSDDVVSGLDAKTLLLGDIVENASWWAGHSNSDSQADSQDPEHSTEAWQGIVSARTPRINWNELNTWYNRLLHAGDDWNRRWQALKPDRQNSLRISWEQTSLRQLQFEIHESQRYLLRTLLKATENLLKRPRRPLNGPEHCRFLLMLLANPLLQRSSRRPVGGDAASGMASESTAQSQAASHVPESAASKHRPPKDRKVSSMEHHTGIVKRILGLVSNLSGESQHFLVSWMARFSDSHLQNLVDLVNSFVNHRLTRHQEYDVVEPIDPTESLVPTFSGTGTQHASHVHAALERHPSKKRKKKDHREGPKLSIYGEDWQIRSAARVMSLLFQANTAHPSRGRDLTASRERHSDSAGFVARHCAYSYGRVLPINVFYNSMLDRADLIADYEAWEVAKNKFTFCQYPFFLSIWAKIQILEHDARRQMESKAREAFFDSIMSRKDFSSFLDLKVRRDCLVDDSLRGVSEVVGSGSNDIKKGLRIEFVGEEGVDVGGLRKEWFLLLVREIFDPRYGLFLYDEDSRYCYFNPFCFESSEQFFLVGVLLGLAIYNSTILDIAFPPFVFRKMLASMPLAVDRLTSTPRITIKYTLDDLAEYRPSLAKGLRQLLDFEGDVQNTFCRDFVIEMDRYGEIIQIPLCTNGERRAVTNSNRREFVDLYVQYLLDSAVIRQYEPFKRGFFTVCGGNALSLFQPEEIELLIRGSDEPLDVASLRAVAVYDGWSKAAGPPDRQPQVEWFWQSFEKANPTDQRKMLSFITGSDRIPAMGATNLIIQVRCIHDNEAEVFGHETRRFPTARTCFNIINLYEYDRQEILEEKLWMAVWGSEGFGLK